MRRPIILTAALTAFPLFAQRAQAQEPAQEQVQEPAQEPEQARKKEQLQVQESEQLVTPIPEPKIRAHGPEAPDGQFPSHLFRWRAHAPERVQLGFTYGINQPILTHGFNAAIEVRYKRLVATYSHGQGLDYARFETSGERAAGAAVKLPWTTGGGVGVLLIDELWILADLKVHHFLVDTAVDNCAYTNVTLGAELGWRYFIWKGFNVALVARYWPNIYSTAGRGVILHGPNGTTFLDPPAPQGEAGFLGNVLVGWAFDL